MFWMKTYNFQTDKEFDKWLKKHHAKKHSSIMNFAFPDDEHDLTRYSIIPVEFDDYTTQFLKVEWYHNDRDKPSVDYAEISDTVIDLLKQLQLKYLKGV